MGLWVQCVHSLHLEMWLNADSDLGGLGHGSLPQSSHDAHITHLVAWLHINLPLVLDKGQERDHDLF